MSLMGISVSVGVLVANSVVVIENIFRHKKMGHNNREASYKGTAEVTVAVIASTLTNLVVFLPIANMSSMVGLFLRELALAASFATIFSLIFSFTLTPMLSSLLLPTVEKESKLSKKLHSIYDSWDRVYAKWLAYVLKNKKISFVVIVVSFLAFIITTAYYAPKIGFEFIPHSDDGKIKIEAELPEGYNLHETGEVLKVIEDSVKTLPEVTHILTDLGKISDLNIGTNMAKMDIAMVDAKDRDISVDDAISILVKKLSSVPNARIAVDYGTSMGNGNAAPIQFFLVGHDLDVLEGLKDKVWNSIKDIPGLINLDQSSRAGKPEITVYPNREKMADAGVTTQELALTLRASIEGIESSKYREEGEEYDITVTVKDNDVDTPEKVGAIPVISKTGVQYRLAQLADVEFTNGYTKILHRDKYPSIQFTGAPAAGYPLGNITAEIEKRVDELNLPEGYGMKWSGNVEMMNEMAADFGFAFILAVLLTYMLLAAILESFLQPVFILLTLPLAMIGVFMSLYYTGISFGITSMMAIVMLIGIVVNNAILMLDYTNQLIRDEGMAVRDALIKACPTKLKPIIMSTLAIILGMLPMALGIGDAGAEMRMPLGVVSIGGLLVSTILTLFVIPAFFYITSGKKAANKVQKLV
jgi:hydrophobic/amphiphilic exporter-1 (mainly G- bacteria), HAE1 family